MANGIPAHAIYIYTGDADEGWNGSQRGRKLGATMESWCWYGVGLVWAGFGLGSESGPFVRMLAASCNAFHSERQA